MKLAVIRPFAIRTMLAVGILGFASTGFADQLSPWLGSADQTPFQLDPVTMVAVTFAADPLHTGTVKPAPCPQAGCEIVPNAATTGRPTNGLPKN